MSAEAGGYSVAKAQAFASVAEARTRLEGACDGLLTVTATDAPEQEPFAEWAGGQWHAVSTAAAEPPRMHGRNVRRNVHRATKAIALRGGGLTLSGLDYLPPAALVEAAEPSECLRGHFEAGVATYGRRTACHAVGELQGRCVSLLPTVSGGFQLTQESANGPGSVVLCLSKSVWRDRLALEEGMELEIGAGEPGEICHLMITSVSGTDRNKARYSNAGASSALRARSLRKGSKKGGEARGGKKVVSFGGSVIIDTGKRITSLERDGGAEGLDSIASADIWSDEPGRPASSRDVAGRTEARPKIVFRYTVGAKARSVEFSPDLPGGNAPAPSASPLLSSTTRRKSAYAASKLHRSFFTIGGDPNCNVVLPNCDTKVVAAVGAYENVFTLFTAHNLSDAYFTGATLSPAQQRFATQTGVHLVLDPKRTFPLYDGDTVVFRGTDADLPQLAHDGCCSGLEMAVQLFDPTERYRVKQAREALSSIGMTCNLDMQRQTWLDNVVPQPALARNAKPLGAPREVDEIALEVRAPVRTSRWDGSCEWRYGETEAFALSHVSASDHASIGSSPLMTVSIKDPRMGRCHATISKKGARAYYVEAAKTAGKRSVLALVAASAPPGLGAASTPPHLLVPGEVFRVGASEFRVIGCSKNPEKDAAARFAKKPTSSGRRVSSFRLNGRANGSSSARANGSSAARANGSSAARANGSNARGPAPVPARGRMSSLDKHASQIVDDSYEDSSDDEADSNAFEELQEQANLFMRNKIEKRGAIALIRHRPNVDEAQLKELAISKFVTEDNVELQVSNNVDKSFGLARVDEYGAVLQAFGLDEETRSITFPDLSDFMIIQCTKGPLQRRIFLISEHECTIGSSPSCCISVENDPLISPLHCRVVFNPIERHWRLIDASSRSGTFLRVSSGDGAALLQPGQRLIMGNSQLRVLAHVRESRQTLKGGKGIRRQIKSVFLNKGGPGGPMPVNSVSHQDVLAASRKEETSGRNKGKRRSSTPPAHLSAVKAGAAASGQAPGQASPPAKAAGAEALAPSPGKKKKKQSAPAVLLPETAELDSIVAPYAPNASPPPSPMGPSIAAPRGSPPPQGCVGCLLM